MNAFDRVLGRVREFGARHQLISHLRNAVASKHRFGHHFVHAYRTAEHAGTYARNAREFQHALHRAILAIRAM